MPVLDWFYAASRLRRGGIALVDDVQLPAVRALLQFLDPDPRWPVVARHEKWVAYERTTSGPLTEEWTEQPHYRVATPTRWSRAAWR
jgi:hypothetical protein